MDVLARIQQLMDERGWTMYRLSKESGLHIKTVCNMFNRNSMPSIPTLEAMCKAFGISVPQFFSQMEIEEVTPELKEIIHRWPHLSATQREAFMSMIRAFSAEQE